MRAGPVVRARGRTGKVRSVRNWRVLTAIVAVILAGVAAVLAYKYLSEADDRARSDVELVPVLRAATEIPKGTSGDVAVASDLVEQAEVPRNAVPDNAVTDVKDLKGLVAAAVISQKQFITVDSFVKASQLTGFAGSVEDGMQAVSINVDDTHGVGGFVVPNDTVNVLVTTQLEPLTTPQNSDLGGSLSTTAYLLPGLKVLAVGETTATTPPSTSETGATTPPQTTRSGLITVEVTPRQALQIAHAVSGQGQIYLSLNPPGFDVDTFKTQTPDEIVEAYNWFDQTLTKVEDLRRQIAAADGATITGP